MLSRLLITYSTGHGSTTGVAEEIARAFRNAATTVDVVDVDEAPDPNAYDAIVIGSAIRYDTWMPGARAYVQAHQMALSERPTACFFTCMALSVTSGTAQGHSYANKIAALSAPIKPVRVGQFAGALDFENFPPLQRLPARVLFGVLGVKRGDHRDFQAIHTWSLDCLQALQTPSEDN